MKAELKPEELRATDFRIGNLIRRHYSETHSVEITVTWKDIQVIHDKQNDVYEPIELSEEWLKKAGFNKNHKLILPYRGAFESYLIADSGEQRIQICRTGYWAYDPEIMYVHQTPKPLLRLNRKRTNL